MEATTAWPQMGVTGVAGKLPGSKFAILARRDGGACKCKQRANVKHQRTKHLL